MKNIAAFGGSFDPPHPGHFETPKFLYSLLPVDEICFLFSHNWQKDENKYAGLDHREAMWQLLYKHYAELPFKTSDVQYQMNTHITYDVLEELRKQNPDHNYIWVMGADNLASFETWEHAEDLIQKYPIVVLDRPGYTNKALNSYTAKTFAHLKLDDPKELGKQQTGWCFVQAPQVNMSSSELLNQMRAGKTSFDGPFQDVANYIIANKLYGIDPDRKPQPKKDQNILHP